jgi:hypothetical protein
VSFSWVLGLFCCFLEGLFGVLGGLLCWGSFGAGLGVRQRLHKFFGFWISRGFCLGRVGVEAFVSYILRVY